MSAPPDFSKSKTVVLGSGPIVIGQACEFDYSGTQACKALKEQGYPVVLINSNPATIMTDIETADRVYIEPLTVECVEKILQKERPKYLIATLGGQTALNLALALEDKGVLKELSIQMIGAKADAIRKAENREEFRGLLKNIGASYPESFLVRSFKEGIKKAQTMQFPIILRPNYTLGGSGGGVSHSMEEFENQLASALRESPTSEVLLEKSLLGWREFELEVMRDKKGTFVVICSIENFDPCGVHTGDSIAIAPQQTLSDKEYQAMRTEAKKIIEAVGVETGGANIQFAVHPETKERLVIEMNPRVSRSSALASKATGFPIAKIAALLAMGKTLDEIPNDITQVTPSCYEPALDYIVTKAPRFDFEKFEGSKDTLTTQMKSVGEVMGIGRTFTESLIKSLWSLEKNKELLFRIDFSEKKLSHPGSQRIYHIFEAFRRGFSVRSVSERTGVHPWFLSAVHFFVEMEDIIKKDFSIENLKQAKKMGFTDEHLAFLTQKTGRQIRKLRWKHNILPAFYSVDTCAGEFESKTPYYYSTYSGERKAPPKNKKTSVIIFGSGPNRIGQGIEFDYGCVRAVKALKKLNLRALMINSNPETVSTDYDTSDELYFEPLSEEHVLEILKYTKPDYFCAQFGGQTALELSRPALDEGFSILGSSMKTIDLAEDRLRFAELCLKSGFKIPKASHAVDWPGALKASKNIGYPLLCRPSYVLGGRRMQIIENEKELEDYFKRYQGHISPKNPCLIDQFLDDFLEIDVDMVRSKKWSLIGGVLEHIEAAGIHSGDSMAVFPPQRLKAQIRQKIEECAFLLAQKLGVIGLLNLQLAVKNDEIFVLEANPRSSRSVPFLAKAAGRPIVDWAVQALIESEALPLPDQVSSPPPCKPEPKNLFCVKGVLFPFKKFDDAESILGPEMRSIGEVMGRGPSYAEALFKALSHKSFPSKGEVFLSLKDKDKEPLIPEILELLKMGYTLSATKGTARFLRSKGAPCLAVKKVREGRPHCVDRIRSGQVAFVFNTTSGRASIEASFGIRRSCVDHFIPCITDKDAIRAFLLALKKKRELKPSISPLT